MTPEQFAETALPLLQPFAELGNINQFIYQLTTQLEILLHSEVNIQKTQKEIENILQDFFKNISKKLFVKNIHQLESLMIEYLNQYYAVPQAYINRLMEDISKLVAKLGSDDLISILIKDEIIPQLYKDLTINKKTTKPLNFQILKHEISALIDKFTNNIDEQYSSIEDQLLNYLDEVIKPIKHIINASDMEQEKLIDGLIAAIDVEFPVIHAVLSEELYKYFQDVMGKVQYQDQEKNWVELRKNMDYNIIKKYLYPKLDLIIEKWAQNKSAVTNASIDFDDIKKIYVHRAHDECLFKVFEMLAQKVAITPALQESLCQYLVISKKYGLDKLIKTSHPEFEVDMWIKDCFAKYKAVISSLPSQIKSAYLENDYQIFDTIEKLNALDLNEWHPTQGIISYLNNETLIKALEYLILYNEHHAQVERNSLIQQLAHLPEGVNENRIKKVLKAINDQSPLFDALYLQCNVQTLQAIKQAVQNNPVSASYIEKIDARIQALTTCHKPIDAKAVDMVRVQKLITAAKEESLYFDALAPHCNNATIEKVRNKLSWCNQKEEVYLRKLNMISWERSNKAFMQHFAWFYNADKKPPIAEADNPIASTSKNQARNL